MITSSGPELMSHISPPPTQHQLQPTPSSNLHPIFIILPHPNNNMTRTGAKHTSKDNETHALPQKSVSTTSCDSLLWEREQENRRTGEQENRRKREQERLRSREKVRKSDTCECSCTQGETTCSMFPAAFSVALYFSGPCPSPVSFGHLCFDRALQFQKSLSDVLR